MVCRDVAAPASVLKTYRLIALFTSDTFVAVVFLSSTKEVLVSHSIKTLFPAC